jgi:hypothetical protein
MIQCMQWNILEQLSPKQRVKEQNTIYITICILKKNFLKQVPLDHTSNPSYLEGWDQEDHGLRPAWAEFESPDLQNNQSKWTAGVAQALEHLLCKHLLYNTKP